MEETQGRVNGATGLHTVQAGATSPLVRALFSGAFVGGLILLVALQNRWRGAGYWGMYGFLITSALVWFYLQIQFSKILYLIEKATGQDLNNDNVLGEPVEVEPAGVTVTVRDVSDAGGLSVCRYIRYGPRILCRHGQGIARSSGIKDISSGGGFLK